MNEKELRLEKINLENIVLKEEDVVKPTYITQKQSNEFRSVNITKEACKQSMDFFFNLTK